MRRELVCTEPSTPPRLAVRTRVVPRVAAEQVLVRVGATSVNPIDIKRAGGYGRRLLGLKGAASFPLVLGNDVAGTVEAVGAGVSRFAPGQRVFGLLATGKNGGAHATYVIVPQEQLARARRRSSLRVRGHRRPRVRCCCRTGPQLSTRSASVMTATPTSRASARLRRRPCVRRWDVSPDRCRSPRRCSPVSTGPSTVADSSTFSETWTARRRRRYAIVSEAVRSKPATTQPIHCSQGSTMTRRPAK